jgi:hypothetical protein
VILPRSLAAMSGLALAGLLLSGCGASVGIHPGSAAIVGDESISLNKVDDTTRLYCQAYLPQLQQSSSSNGPIPLKLLRQFVAASLAQRLLGQQLADQYAVQPTAQYATHMTQVAQQFASTPAAQKQAVIDVEGGSPYLQTIQVALGRKLLAGSGQAAGIKAALQRGEVATQDWLKTHTIEMDPVFAVAVDNGQFKPDPGAGGTSYALSPIAAAGAASGQPSTSYTSQLTASQVCG